VHHRVFQPFVVQHGRIDKRGEFRLAANDIFRLGSHPIPDRIERRKLRALWIDLMHGHVLHSQIRLFRSAL
jgi:hypothetical protein